MLKFNFTNCETRGKYFSAKRFVAKYQIKKNCTALSMPMDTCINLFCEFEMVAVCGKRLMRHHNRKL